MRTLHIVFPSRATFDLTPTHLFVVCALIAAACLMFQYVALLNESVARGMRVREQPTVQAPSPGATAALAEAGFESGNAVRVRATGSGRAVH